MVLESPWKVLQFVFWQMVKNPAFYSITMLVFDLFITKSVMFISVEKIVYAVSLQKIRLVLFNIWDVWANKQMDTHHDGHKWPWRPQMTMTATNDHDGHKRPWQPQTTMTATNHHDGHKRPWWPQTTMTATNDHDSHKPPWWPQTTMMATNDHDGHKRPWRPQTTMTATCCFSYMSLSGKLSHIESLYLSVTPKFYTEVLQQTLNPTVELWCRTLSRIKVDLVLHRT